MARILQVAAYFLFLSKCPDFACYLLSRRLATGGRWMMGQGSLVSAGRTVPHMSGVGGDVCGQVCWFIFLGQPLPGGSQRLRASG